MDEEIVLARDRNGYRVVTGRHRLDAVLGLSNEVFAEVAGEDGKAKVFRTETGVLVCKDSRNLPLLNPHNVPNPP